MRVLMLAGLLVLPLAACDLDKMVADGDRDTCRGYGFQPGTDAFANCMQNAAIHRDDQVDQEMAQERADDAARKAKKKRKQQQQDAIDPTPQFDAQGNPNFDTHGNYIGGHGDGVLVDPPDQ